MTNRPRAGHELELTGTVWDSRNWSCAYDSVCVTLFHPLRTRSPNFVDAASRLSPLMAFLSNGTRSLLTETSDFQQHLNNLRDGLRDKLSDADSARFPRFGPATIGVYGLLSRVIGFDAFEAIGRLDCTNCHKPRTHDRRTLGNHATRSNVQAIYDLHGLDRRCPDGGRPKVSFEHWLSAYYLHSFWPHTLARFSPASPCPFCSHACPTRLSLQIMRAPIFFFVDVSDWDLETNPFHVLHLQMVDNTHISYRLCGAIYFGGNHWTCRWISSDGQVWSHDGSEHGGTLRSDGRLVEPLGRSNLCSLRTSVYRTLSVLIYALDT